MKYKPLDFKIATDLPITTSKSVVVEKEKKVIRKTGRHNQSAVKNPDINEVNWQKSNSFLKLFWKILEFWKTVILKF